MAKRILVFGNSIVWGASDKINGGWVDIFKRYFYEIGDFDEVFNLGNPGKDTRKLLAQIESEIRARIKAEHYDRDIIIIMAGFNDSQYVISPKANRVPVDEFKDNYLKIINICKEYVKNVAAVSLFKVEEKKVNPLPWGPDKAYMNKNIIKYNEIIKQICINSDILFIDIYNLLNDSDLEDGIHPNSKGHEKIFMHVKNLLISNKLI